VNPAFTSIVGHKFLKLARCASQAQVRTMKPQFTESTCILLLEVKVAKCLKIGVIGITRNPDKIDSHSRDSRPRADMNALAIEDYISVPTGIALYSELSFAVCLN
jgi:hypothetical protein